MIVRCDYAVNRTSLKAASERLPERCECGCDETLPRRTDIVRSDYADLARAAAPGADGA